MSTHGGTRAALLGVVGLIAVLAAPSAHAATTIGVDLSTAPNNNTTCGGEGCTQATTSVGTALVAPGGFTAPSRGVIVRWRVRTSAAEQETGPVDAVFRVIAGNHGAGSSAPVVLADADAIQEFSTRIPIAGVLASASISARVISSAPLTWRPRPGTSGTRPCQTA